MLVLVFVVVVVVVEVQVQMSAPTPMLRMMLRRRAGGVALAVDRSRLSVYLSLCISLHPPVGLSARLPVCPSVCLSVLCPTMQVGVQLALRPWCRACGYGGALYNDCVIEVEKSKMF